ncbi:MAG: PorP/SprF family type IX secretion system membrane protein [Fluviicola sp.]|nr:PorP/SprF family type IX secretion system membrane protein [Fluviicola sp.]
MKVQHFSIILGFILIFSGAKAQQLPLGSHYFMNPFVLNPAYTGSGEDVNVFLTHRSQFSGIAGSPQTTYLTIDGPINVKGVGLGLNAYSDVTNILSRNGVSGNYSYSLNLWSGHTLTFGLAAGVVDHTINYDQAIVRDVDDPSLFEQKMHRTVFTADLGLLYEWKQLQVGFAVPQLLGNKARFKADDGTINYFDMQRHFVGSAKYVFDVSAKQGITVYPMVVVRGVAGAPVQFDITTVADWKSRGWFAVSYRSKYAIGVSAGVRYKNLSVGYSHDFGVTKVRSYAGATHEFLLSYQFGCDTRKRLDQHDRELEELRQRTTQNEADIDQVESELEAIRQSEQALSDSLNATKAAFNDSIVSLRNQLKEQVKSAVDQSKTPSDNPKGNYRTYSNTDFLDENGMPMAAGYYVVIGSFSVKDNAITFQKQITTNEGETASITFNKSINIYNVYMLYTQDYPTANTERNHWKVDYKTAWVLKLE